ncbi:single-stranded nucleic acid binding R3H protein [Striga asiatica]|uniref:Single-stranded nucleic acid binding R3H protein n=1 Tax=Striga asiatica TaxID=4170 RepID=A0A5A7R2L0_STRAF|nr:single-stranded nucleic acid binding R3H protein [Striga asiatica]
MDLTSQAPVEASVNQPPPETAAAYVSEVDPFLVEALQNPRHRLTIHTVKHISPFPISVLRMELDVQNFMQLPDLHQFEFPHFPTSYLRLAAHRVAQHYGLQTIVQDVVDGQGIRITVIKKPESKFPVVCLSQVPAKDSENNKLDQIKIVIRPRPKASSRDTSMLGLKDGQVRSVEERREEYDRARARIFNRPNNSDWEDSIDRDSSNEANFHVDDNYCVADGDKSLCRETERIMILFKPPCPDISSLCLYVKNIPTAQDFGMAPFNVQKFQPPFFQFDSLHPQVGQIYPQQVSVDFTTPFMSPYSAIASNQNSEESALYVPWSTQSMMYAQSYGQLRHAFFQVVEE